jgi:uncharacterized surface protein with fasciclin (FAS1) repeats
MTALRSAAIAAATAAAVALLAFPALAKPHAAAPPPPPAAPVAPPVPAPTADVIDTLKARGNFTTFLKLLDAAGVTADIKALKSVTIFAPTDAAFASLAPGIVDGWLDPETREGLQHLMLYHGVNTEIMAAQIAGHKGDVPTFSTLKVTLDGSDPTGKLKINDANVIQADVRATNGNIFIIDKVLAPR